MVRRFRAWRSVGHCELLLAAPGRWHVATNDQRQDPEAGAAQILLPLSAGFCGNISGLPNALAAHGRHFRGLIRSCGGCFGGSRRPDQAWVQNPGYLRRVDGPYTSSITNEESG